MSYDDATKLLIAKRGPNSLTSKNNSVTITTSGDPYGGVDLSVSPDIGKDWDKKIEELAWLVAQRTKEIREVAQAAEDYAQQAKDKVDLANEEAFFAKDTAKEAKQTADSVRKDADDGKFKGPKGEDGDYKTPNLQWESKDSYPLFIAPRTRLLGTDLEEPTWDKGKKQAIISPLYFDPTSPYHIYFALVLGLISPYYTSLKAVSWSRKTGGQIHNTRY